MALTRPGERGAAVVAAIAVTTGAVGVVAVCMVHVASSWQGWAATSVACTALGGVLALSLIGRRTKGQRWGVIELSSLFALLLVAASLAVAFGWLISDSRQFYD